MDSDLERKIRRLDAVTIGQIAAGEVIERPVSVVKELVENALDAGARRIVVTIKAGGLELIEVVDDGSGIASGDLPLALERHATSKLLNTDSLEALGTLGFRGEGLASIASVARVALISRQADDQLASRVEAFEEVVGAVEAASGPVGTRVIVRDLFANVPVRREYLRTAQAEATRISSFLSSLALGYPHVNFHLRVDDRDVLQLPSAKGGFDRLAHVFGRDIYGKMLEIGDVATGMHGTVKGYVSKPGFDRGDRRQQMLFVNGRLLRSTQLAGAWTAAYAGFALSGRHAFGVLLIDLPPDHLDPNVHPTKSDVRFRYPAQVSDAVKRAIVTTLSQHARERLGEAISPSPSSLSSEGSHVSSPLSATNPKLESDRFSNRRQLSPPNAYPSLRAAKSPPSPAAPAKLSATSEITTEDPSLPISTLVPARDASSVASASPSDESASEREIRLWKQSQFSGKPFNEFRAEPKTTLEDSPRSRIQSADHADGSPQALDQQVGRNEQKTESPSVASPSWQSARRLSGGAALAEERIIESPSTRWRVLAQLDQAFILSTDGRGIVLVDQHAAHERVAYEAICAAALNDETPPVSQPLLIPEIIELNYADAQALEESLDALREAGVELASFGERVYRLLAMPSFLAARHFDVRHYIADLDEETPDLDARERIWATMACHSVVRAGEKMQIAEMQSILDRLALCANPMHCPHGRPTIVRFDAPQIAKLFRR